MTSLTATQRIALFLLTALALTDVGCVSRQAYEKARAEADDLARSLEIARTDVTELDRRITELQSANRREDAVTSELRAAIQREQDQLPILRQRADDQLASLQAQVAHLVNQSRALIRQIADAKQESASLQAMATQYKQELEESRFMPAPVAAETNEPMTARPALTLGSSAAPPAALTGSPQQVSQVSPVAPLKSTIPPPPAAVEPAPVEDSWTGMIMSWLSSLWSLIFG